LRIAVAGVRAWQQEERPRVAAAALQAGSSRAAAGNVRYSAATANARVYGSRHLERQRRALARCAACRTAAPCYRR